MFCKKTISDLKPYKVVPQDAWLNPDDVLKLDWNESTQLISPVVKQALLAAIENVNLNWYPNVQNAELLNAISCYVGMEPENIMYFASSDSAQEYIARTFLESYDNVLIVGPTYDNFRVTCQSESYNIHFFYLNSEFDINLDELRKKIVDIEPKLVYISNPNNPTGTIYELNTVKFLIEQFPDVLFLIDEAYIEFGSIESGKSLVVEHDNIIITRTFSKAFGLAGFRIGFIISNQSNIEYIGRIRNPKSITSLTQVAALAALNDISYMHNYVHEVKRAKEYFISELDMLGIPHVEGGGNFVLLKPIETKAFIYFLKENKIYVRDYTQVLQLNGFDCRITVGTTQEMKRVINVIQQFLKR
jgi:histidinol-phosphate aminotransferase